MLDEILANLIANSDGEGEITIKIRRESTGGWNVQAEDCTTYGSELFPAISRLIALCRKRRHA